MLLSYAQQDTIKVRAVTAGLGIHLTQAMYAAPAVAGQAKLRYRKFELLARYGKNTACLKDVRGYDEVDLAGDWLEVSLGLMLPYFKNKNGMRAGVGLGIANTEIENREIFEALPPFQDLTYVQKYSNVNQKYLTFSLGYQYRLSKNVEFGCGAVAFHLWNEVNVPPSASYTPFMARSPVGVYAELSFVF